VRSGQETRAVLSSAFDQWSGADGDEAGQVLVFCAQTVSNPGAQARARSHSLTRIHLQTSAGMIHIVGYHRADDAQAIGARANVRKQFAYVESRLPALGELPGRSQQVALLTKIELRRRLAIIPG